MSLEATKMSLATFTPKTVLYGVLRGTQAATFLYSLYEVSRLMPWYFPVGLYMANLLRFHPGTQLTGAILTYSLGFETALTILGVDFATKYIEMILFPRTDTKPLIVAEAMFVHRDATVHHGGPDHE